MGIDGRLWSCPSSRMVFLAGYDAIDCHGNTLLPSDSGSYLEDYRWIEICFARRKQLEPRCIAAWRIDIEYAGGHCYEYRWCVQSGVNGVHMLCLSISVEALYAV
jgi:hypothetical protein